MTVTSRGPFLGYDTWPLPLRWLVALGIVPALPFAVVALPALFLRVLDIEALVLLLLPFVTATLLYIPIIWLCFLPLYFTFCRSRGHSQDSYIQSAMVAALVIGLGLAAYVLLTYPRPGLALAAVVFGIIVGVPIAGLIGLLIWRTLWEGRRPASG